MRGQTQRIFSVQMMMMVVSVMATAQGQMAPRLGGWVFKAGKEPFPSGSLIVLRPPVTAATASRNVVYVQRGVQMGCGFIMVGRRDHRGPRTHQSRSVIPIAQQQRRRGLNGAVTGVLVRRVRRGTFAVMPPRLPFVFPFLVLNLWRKKGSQCNERALSWEDEVGLRLART